jgi:hypothetical protein
VPGLILSRRKLHGHENGTGDSEFKRHLSSLSQPGFAGAKRVGLDQSSAAIADLNLTIRVPPEL